MTWSVADHNNGQITYTDSITVTGAGASSTESTQKKAGHSMMPGLQNRSDVMIEPQRSASVF